MSLVRPRRRVPCTSLAAVCGAALLGFALDASLAHAAWSVNAGYHNPAGSTYGLNLLYQGQKWGFEVGVGYIDAQTIEEADKKNGDETDDAAAADETSDDKAKKKTTGANVNLGGDVNLKYFLASGGARPYLQAGVGVGLGATAGKHTGLGAGTGEGFAGLGIIFGRDAVYAYVSYNITASKLTFAQVGIGVGL
jgi:hypothetical protein